MKRCHYCSELIEDDSLTCPYCRSDFRSSDYMIFSKIPNIDNPLEFDYKNLYKLLFALPKSTKSLYLSLKDELHVHLPDLLSKTISYPLHALKDNEIYDENQVNHALNGFSLILTLMERILFELSIECGLEKISNDDFGRYTYFLNIPAKERFIYLGNKLLQHIPKYSTQIYNIYYDLDSILLSYNMAIFNTVFPSVNKYSYSTYFVERMQFYLVFNNLIDKSLGKINSTDISLS